MSKTMREVNKPFQGYVYGLFCVCSGCRSDNPGEVRYVGITTKSPRTRLRAHLADARAGRRTAKDGWIRKHQEENIRYVLLDEITSCLADLLSAEVNWIAHLETFKGARGLNLTQGGEGVLGLVMSDETREKFKDRTRKQLDERHPRAKLTRKDVEEIIELIWAGHSNSQISKRYDVSTSSIQKIRQGSNWPNVPRPEGRPPRPKPSGGKRSVPFETARKIRSEFSGEWGELKRLAGKYDLSETTVSLILNRRRRYADIMDEED